MKDDLIKTFHKNWENSKFVRTTVSALLGILTITAIVGGALIIATYPWLGLLIVFAVFATAGAVKWHEVINKRMKK